MEEEKEDEEEEEDAGEGVGGGGEAGMGDETLGEGLPLLVTLWRLDEALVPTARGIWLGGWCSPPPLLAPPGRLTPPPGVNDSEEEDTPSGCLEDRGGIALCLAAAEPEPGCEPGSWAGGVGGARADAAAASQTGARLGAALRAVECARAPWQWRSSRVGCRSEARGRPCRGG